MSKDSANNKLREKAEAKVRKKSNLILDLTLEESKTLLHELEVHQVELEMQNEELREAQHRLEEARDEYTDLFDFAPIGYLILNEKGVIININLTACKLLGVERSLIKGKPLSAYITNGESRSFFINLRKAFVTGVLHSFEIEMNHKSKGKFIALLQGAITKDEVSESSLCRVSLIDVTEQKEAEILQLRHEDLQKEKENIQQYFDLAPVIFLLTDTKNNVQMINRKGCELLGYQNLEIIGKNWFKNFVSEVNHNMEEESILNFEDENLSLPSYFESKLLCKNGELRIVAWTNVCLLDKRGALLGTLMAGEDITERKQLELRKQQYTEDLEDIVEVRTKKLKEALQNEKMINEMKTTFISMASHEFRTPLTSVLSSAILIQKYNDLKQYTKELRHIERIKVSVKQMTDILEDFLSLDKLERGIVSAHKVTFDLQLFTKDMIEELEWMLKEGQQIQYKHKGNHTVFLDQNILRNIFLNLISNAIKYSDVDIKLSTVVKNEIVNISIVDKGIGIPIEDQKHLFKKFFRAKNVSNIQGTGLGLSIVKHYVELHEGSIIYKSEQGKGSEFSISLPQISGKKK